MKKIAELYQEILQDERLKGEFVQAAKANQLEAFLLKNDCNATLSEVQEFAEKKQSELGSLSDAELDAAAGGADTAEAWLSIFTLGGACAGIAFHSATGTKVGRRRESSERLLCDD